MKCPDCGRPMEAKGKDSSSGRDVREYYCGRCGLIAFVDEGVAWSRVISSESKVDYDAEEASVPDDGVLKIIRSDELKEDAIRASAQAALAAWAAKEAASGGEASKLRKRGRGATTLVVVAALLALISMLVWTQTSWGAAALDVLGSFAGSLFRSR